MINPNLPKPLMENYEWQERAKCKGEDTELFYLAYNLRGAKKAKQEALAISVCKQCPVVSECLAFAIDSEEPYGIWGGMTEDQRRKIILRKKIKTNGTD